MEYWTEVSFVYSDRREGGGRQDLGLDLFWCLFFVFIDFVFYLRLCLFVLHEVVVYIDGVMVGGMGFLYISDLCVFLMWRVMGITGVIYICVDYGILGFCIFFFLVLALGGLFVVSLSGCTPFGTTVTHKIIFFFFLSWRLNVSVANVPYSLEKGGNLDIVTYQHKVRLLGLKKRRNVPIIGGKRPPVLVDCIKPHFSLFINPKALSDM